MYTYSKPLWKSLERPVAQLKNWLFPAEKINNFSQNNIGGRVEIMIVDRQPLDHTEALYIPLSNISRRGRGNAIEDLKKSRVEKKPWASENCSVLQSKPVETI